MKIGDCPVTPQQSARLLGMIEERSITRPQSKELLAWMFATGLDPEVLAGALDMHVFDESVIEGLVQAVVDAPENARLVEQWRGGKDKVLNALVGQVIEYSNGRAFPDVAKTMLEKLK